MWHIISVYWYITYEVVYFFYFYRPLYDLMYNNNNSIKYRFSTTYPFVIIQNVSLVLFSTYRGVFMKEYTVKEVSSLLNKHEETIKRWLRANKFPNAHCKSDKEG